MTTVDQAARLAELTAALQRHAPRDAAVILARLAMIERKGGRR